MLSPPISISPGAAYNDGFAMTFSYPAVIGGSPGGGLALLMPDYNGNPEGSMALSFHAQAGKSYIVDCRTTTVAAEVQVQLTVNGSGPAVASFATQTSGGHIAWPLFSTTGEDVRYDVTPLNASSLIVNACDLTSVG